jgi:hypothetical protein
MRTFRLVRGRSSLIAITAALATTAGIALPATPAAAATPRGAVVSDIAADADWLLTGQLPDGAIAWYVDKQHISPYLANYAAVGLAEARKQTGSHTYSDAAWAWLSWYAAHEDANGFVTDYNVDANGVETSTGDEDSTDAYAGTFLLAARAAYAADPNAAKLGALHAGVTGAVAAIEATQDADGLTWAKPTWSVKYLMDETEAYDGLVSAQSLAASLHDSALKARAQADASALKSGIASLWDSPTGAYDWAKDGGGYRTPTDWGVLYSDAMEQAWVAGSNAVSKSRATALVGRLQADEPQWSDPTALADINGSTGTVGYWPVAGWALLHVGQAGAAASAATSIRSAAVAAARAWPFTTGNAGQLIVLESGDTSLIAP